VKRPVPPPPAEPYPEPAPAALPVHFEFGGAPGALALTLLLPLVCYALVRLSHSGGCLQLAPLSLPPALPLSAYGSLAGAAAFAAWFLLCLALHMLLPGKLVQGTVLRDGSRLTYKLNGAPHPFKSRPPLTPASGLRVLAAISLLVASATRLGLFDPLWVADNFLPLLSGGNAFAALLALHLYARSFAPGRLLAAGGDSGRRVYDFFIGRELNPRWSLSGLQVDLKEFCELTPGLIGWLLLNCCFAYAQKVEQGAVSASMALVLLFQGVYVLDALACEPAILTTMDITTDGFGYMLAFGDLVWVPFTYSLQARFLRLHPVALPAPALAAVLALQLLGYALFRGANSQKDAFRRDPKGPAVRHLRSMATRRGTRLLTSGYWGVARHVNYTGDWLMGLAWCLSCGASSVPYFYAIYFGALLLHRERRDEAACREKYGEDWAAYCKLVPWRMIPGVY
jgi:hypothetical protein